MDNPEQFIATLAAHPAVRAALDRPIDALIDLTIAVQQIPAPTFAEAQRARWIAEQFRALGLRDVALDELHNVYGRYPGRLAAAPVVISAHSDTVFPAETDLTVRRENGRLHGPGIADNSAGVAGLLQLATLLRDHAIVPQRDIWLASNVGEEGLGDLRGMRAVVERFPDAGAFIVLEGGMYGYVLHEAIGVQRYAVTVETDGGHSWSDFGRPSAVHVAAHVIDRIAHIRVPDSPKTTFNVGVVQGGTSINTIAAQATFQLDLRSEDGRGLAYLLDQLDRILRRARRRSGAPITATPIGNRPAGQIEREHPLVQQAAAALRAVGAPQVYFLRGSTDANVPLSRGLPAVCIGLGRSANAHRLDEYLETDRLPQGMQQLLLLALAAAGGVAEAHYRP